MADYRSCPNCGHQPSGISVSHMEVFQCDDCGKKYCWKCPGSNQGHCCPKCSSKNYSVAGTCYVR